MTEITISIIIPTYNGEAELPDQLQALIPQLPPSAEIILADNGSTDSTASLADRYQKRCRLRLVDASERRGNAAARNIGAASAAGEVFLFLDQDDEVAAGWVQALSTAAAEDGIAVGALPIFDDWGARNEESRDAPSRLLGTYHHKPFGMSSNMGVTKRAFESLNGFDERFAAATDVDFCWRAQRLGLTINWCDRAVVRKRAKPSGAFAQHRSYGRDDVLLYLEHRSDGMPRSAGLSRRLAWAASRALLLHQPATRRVWSRTVGRLVGRAEASIGHRTFYL